MTARICVECGRDGERGFVDAPLELGKASSLRCASREACLTRQLDEARRQLRERGKRRLPRRRQYRETTDVAKAVARLIRALGRRVAEEDVDALDALNLLDKALADAFVAAVGQPGPDGLGKAGGAGLRRNYPDRLIGERLGMTRQAVEQRWPRKRPQEPSAS